MKKLFIHIIVCSLFLVQRAFAQSVTIDPQATGSGIVDIKSTAKGIFIPAITTAQRISINPANAAQKGLLVFDTNTNTYWYVDGSQWVQLSQGVITLPYSNSFTGNLPNQTVFNLSGTNANAIKGSVNMSSNTLLPMFGYGIGGFASASSGVIPTPVGVYGEGTSALGVGVWGKGEFVGGRFETTNLVNGNALRTIGKVQMTGIGEGAGKILTSDANGNATWENPNVKPAFYAKLNTNQFVNTMGVYFQPAEVIDATNDYDPATGTFTAPSSGLYQFSVSITWDPNASTLREIYLNAFNPANLLSSITSSGGPIYQNITFMRQMSATETIKIFLRHNNTSGGINILAAPAATFSGFKIN
jgi:C1q domain